MSLGLKGIVFDLDGTLVNSLHDIATGINLTRKDYGLPALPEPEITRRVGDGSAALVRETVPVSSAQAPEALQRYLSHYSAHVLDTTVLFPGLDALLKQLVSRRLAVVTNKNAVLAEAILAGLGVRKLFDAVLGGDSLPTRKPHPGPLLYLTQRWGLDPAEIGLVGDGLHDIEAGKAAGLVTLGVTWGVAGQAALAAAGASYLVETVADLGRLLA